MPPRDLYGKASAELKICRSTNRNSTGNPGNKRWNSPRQFLGWAYLIGVGGLGFLFVITLVVFVHELGHFLAARYFGVRVESFSIGFGRAIVGFTDRYGTYWKIGWLPLGGYVKFWGDEGVSSDARSRKDRSRLGGRTRGIVPPQAALSEGDHRHRRARRQFHLRDRDSDKPVSDLRRRSSPHRRSGASRPGRPRPRQGFKSATRVLSIDGQPISEFDDIVRIVTVADGRALDFRVLRNGHEADHPRHAARHRERRRPSQQGHGSRHRDRPGHAPAKSQASSRARPRDQPA